MTNQDVAIRLAAMQGAVRDMATQAADRDAKDALGYLSDVLEHMVDDLSDDATALTEFHDAKLTALFS